jgi:hypothetical protein
LDGWNGMNLEDRGGNVVLHPLQLSRMILEGKKNFLFNDFSCVKKHGENIIQKFGGEEKK